MEKMLKNKKGVSMVTLAITIIVMIILASVAFSNSSGMIEDSNEAVTEAEIMADNDEIRALLTYAILDDTAKVGITLSNGSLVVIGSGDVSYGTGYHLVVGGDEEVIETIKEKTGMSNVRPYKELTAPYVVDYAKGTFERIDEIKFR